MGLCAHAFLRLPLNERMNQVTCCSAVILLQFLQLIGLCVQTCECSEKKVLAQGVPSTLWPLGQDSGSLARANANSRLFAI